MRLHNPNWTPLYPTPQPAPSEAVSRETLLQAIARGWCSPENSHKEMDHDLAIAIAKEVMGINRAIAPSEYDFGGVIDLTRRKVLHIIERDGHKITGFVLTKDNCEKCIVDMSAVRWFFDGNDFFSMMHTDNKPAASEAKDATRYRWLTEDHDDREVRHKRNAILARVAVMSYSAASADIDAAMEAEK